MKQLDDYISRGPFSPIGKHIRNGVNNKIAIEFKNINTIMNLKLDFVPQLTALAHLE